MQLPNTPATRLGGGCGVAHGRHCVSRVARTAAVARPHHQSKNSSGAQHAARARASSRSKALARAAVVETAPLPAPARSKPQGAPTLAKSDIQTISKLISSGGPHPAILESVFEPPYWEQEDFLREFEASPSSPLDQLLLADILQGLADSECGLRVSTRPASAACLPSTARADARTNAEPTGSTPCTAQPRGWGPVAVPARAAESVALVRAGFFETAPWSLQASAGGSASAAAAPLARGAFAAGAYAPGPTSESLSGNDTKALAALLPPDWGAQQGYLPPAPGAHTGRLAAALAPPSPAPPVAPSAAPPTAIPRHSAGPPTTRRVCELLAECSLAPEGAAGSWGNAVLASLPASYRPCFEPFPLAVAPPPAAVAAPAAGTNAHGAKAAKAARAAQQPQVVPQVFTMELCARLQHEREAQEAARATQQARLAAEEAQRAVKVSVAVTRPTQPGEVVVLVGSHPSLGSWDLGAALRLSWSAGHVWRGDVTLPAGAGAFEYKAVVCSGTSCAWEAGGNRTACLGGRGGAVVTLEHAFRL